MSTIKQAYEAGFEAALLKYKTAAIFGASSPSHLEQGAIPYDQRRNEYEAYLTQKGREAPTGYLKGGLGGAAAGAAAGGLMGAGVGSPLVGAGIGAGLGGLAGLFASAVDKDQIGHANQVLSSNGVDQDLTAEIRHRLNMRDWTEDNHRRETRESLRNLSHNMRDTAGGRREVPGYSEQQSAAYGPW